MAATAGSFRGAGNAALDVGAGSEYAILSGVRADYTLTRTSATEVSVAGSDGNDSLVNVEYLQFDDTTGTIWELAIM